MITTVGVRNKFTKFKQAEQQVTELMNDMTLPLVEIDDIIIKVRSYFWVTTQEEYADEGLIVGADYSWNHGDPSPDRYSHDGYTCCIDESYSLKVIGVTGNKVRLVTMRDSMPYGTSAPIGLIIELDLDKVMSFPEFQAEEFVDSLKTRYEQHRKLAAQFEKLYMEALDKVLENQ